MRVPRSLLRQEITVRPFLGSSAYGPVYGDPVTVRARVEGRRREVRRANGTLIVSSATAVVRPEDAPAVDSHATWDGRAYEVVEVLPGQGLGRQSHAEVLLS